MRSLALSAAVLLVGCASATEVGIGRTLGVIAGVYADDPRITLQTEGRTVRVTVVTYAAHCDAPAGTDAQVSGLTAVVSPYDNRRSCVELSLRVFEHTSTFAFAQAGTTRVVVRGIDISNSVGAERFAGDTIAVERTIVIE